MYWVVGDSYVNSGAAYELIIDILVGKAVINEITEMIKHFVFDLTCDDIGKAEVNVAWFHSTNLPQFFNAACNLQIRPEVLEIRGGKNSPTP